MTVAVETPRGASRRPPEPRGDPTFNVIPAGSREAACLARGDLYAAALAFIDGRIQITGDMFAAIRRLTAAPRRGTRQWLLGRLMRSGVQTWIQTRSRARRNVEFHYDHPTEFYRQFLDERLVYSCAYFESPDLALDAAQRAKLRHVCRKLDIRPGERFLDVGCGFGALVAEASGTHGASATGCTLSSEQARTASAMLEKRGLNRRAAVHLRDYREQPGVFDKIASVGMFEHVGVRRLGAYFTEVHKLLAPDGMFLNHGIARPAGVKAGTECYFLQRHVFPGAELASVGETICVAERAGFEALDVENLRPHYAQTCRAWVARLQEHANRCIALVGEKVFRTWLLYLAATALSFEDGWTEVHQVLFAKRCSPRQRQWSRKYIYS